MNPYNIILKYKSNHFTSIFVIKMLILESFKTKLQEWSLCHVTTRKFCLKRFGLVSLVESSGVRNKYVDICIVECICQIIIIEGHC